MGIFAERIKRIPKVDVEFTEIRIVDLSTGEYTPIVAVPPEYSLHGEIIRTVELPSFEGEYESLYYHMLTDYCKLAGKVGKALVEKCGFWGW